MNKIFSLFAAFWFCVCCQPLLASEKSPARCIGNICINQHGKSPAWLLRKYGVGQVHKDADDSELVIHCYYDARQQLWIELEFSSSEMGKAGSRFTGLFVTTVPMCPIRFSPRKSFPDFTSEYGVKIGSIESDLIKKMGQPKRKDDVRAIESKSAYLIDSSRYASKFGSTRFVYDENPSSLLFNFYGFENGKLVSMWFADSE